MNDNTEKQQEEYFDTHQAAEYLNIAYRTLVVYRANTPARGPVYYKKGRTVIYKKSDLDAYLNREEPIIESELVRGKV